MTEGLNIGYLAMNTTRPPFDDIAERKALYARAQEIFHEEVPWVPIAHANFMVATRAEVQGFRIDPLGYHVVENVDIKDGPPAP